VAVKAMHKALYRDDLTLERAMEQIAALPEKTPATALDIAPDVALMLDFLRLSSPRRGIVR
jgi:UDP-N-acetylglucosamine acyltransferase